MQYNIDEIVKSLDKKYRTGNFNHMRSFKDLVVYFLADILETNPIDIKLIKNIELTNKQLFSLNKKIYNVIVKDIPIEYVSGYTYIYGDKYNVNKNVLIPRQDTETLIETAISEIENNQYKSLLDICTGSGVIGIAIKKHSTLSDITLLDISKKAIKVAVKNAIENGIKNFKYIKSNLFNNIEKGLTYDIITANPPYISKNEMAHLESNVLHEPKGALYGGIDGLDLYRNIIDQAYIYLNQGGALIMEIGELQSDSIIELINNKEKYENIYVVKDLNGKNRVVVCHSQKK